MKWDTPQSSISANNETFVIYHNAPDYTMLYQLGSHITISMKNIPFKIYYANTNEFLTNFLLTFGKNVLEPKFTFTI